MTGLVAPPPPQDAPGQTVEADGWYPPVPLAPVRDRIRLGDGVVTTPRLVSAIEGAILTATRELADWQIARQAEGAGQLDEVTDRTLAGSNAAVLLWHRLIVFLAAAELADLHRDVSATNDGIDRAEEKSTTAEEYRRIAWHAVADLRSIGGDPEPRNRVALV
jgi:hypothetical protein